MRSRCITFAAFATTLSFAGNLLGASCPNADLVRAEAQRARTWRYAWTAINGASAFVGFAALPLVSREHRSDVVVGSAVSAGSALLTLVWPLDVEELDSPEACVDAVDWSRRVESAGRDETSRTSWPWHVLDAGVSAALGAVIAFGLHHPRAAIVAGVGSFVVGEIQLFTQPTGLTDLPPLGLAMRW